VILSITYAVNSVTIDNFGRKMTQSEVEADRLYGEVALLEWTDSFLASMNLTPSDPQDFYQEEEEIIFDRAPQPEQEQRLSKHELKGRVYKKIVWIWGRIGYVFKFNV